MMIRPDCNSVSNSPDPISLPGCTTVCVDVICAGSTDLDVRYDLQPGSVTFSPGGGTSMGPFRTHCGGGTCRVCRQLCFAGGGVQSIAVDICVKDVATGVEMCCTANINIV